MLSNPLHRFSTYNALPSSSMLSNGHVPSSHMHSSDLDSMTHGSQYALQQLQQHVDVHQNSQVHRGHNSKHRQHPYGAPGMNNGKGVNGTGTSGPIRRRISRACDQCNQLRTKCDGQAPCAHCVGNFFQVNSSVSRANRIRIRARLRVYSGTEKARKSLAKRSRTASRGSSGERSEIPYGPIVRGAVTNRVTQ